MTDCFKSHFVFIETGPSKAWILGEWRYTQLSHQFYKLWPTLKNRSCQFGCYLCSEEVEGIILSGFKNEFQHFTSYSKLENQQSRGSQRAASLYFSTILEMNHVASSIRWTRQRLCFTLISTYLKRNCLFRFDTSIVSISITSIFRNPESAWKKIELS